MNSNLETGLFLPIRFYNSSTEQDRYKSQSEGVALINQNFVHVDCASLAPFQIILNNYCEEGTDTIDVHIICTDSGESTDIGYDSDYWEYYTDYDNQRIYMSYLGTQDFGSLGNGRYYLQITVVDKCEYTNIYTSDIFVISNCSLPADLTEYRLYGADNIEKRAIDATYLRIIK